MVGLTPTHRPTIGAPAPIKGYGFSVSVTLSSSPAPNNISCTKIRRLECAELEILRFHFLYTSYVFASGPVNDAVYEVYSVVINKANCKIEMLACMLAICWSALQPPISIDLQLGLSVCVGVRNGL